MQNCLHNLWNANKWQIKPQKRETKIESEWHRISLDAHLWLFHIIFECNWCGFWLRCSTKSSFDYALWFDHDSMISPLIWWLIFIERRKKLSYQVFFAPKWSQSSMKIYKVTQSLCEWGIENICSKKEPEMWKIQLNCQYWQRSRMNAVILEPNQSVFFHTASGRERAREIILTKTFNLLRLWFYFSLEYWMCCHILKSFIPLVVCAKRSVRLNRWRLFVLSCNLIVLNRTTFPQCQTTVTKIDERMTHTHTQNTVRTIMWFAYAG